MAVIGETDPTGQMAILGVFANFYRTVTITAVPFLGDVNVALEIEEGVVKTLDHIKADVQRQMEEVGCHEIPCRDWAIHSRNRATPYNMPIQELRAEDEPLRFNWHEWSPSFETQHMWMGQVYQRIARAGAPMPMIATG